MGSGMSFMDTLFGGTDDSAQKSQELANQLDRELFNKNANQARWDSINLFGAGDDNRRAGTQGAMDIFSETIPAQMEQFRGGNVAAQQTLLAGLPQIQNALMGLPVDLSGLQAQSLPFDASFANQALPETKGNKQMLNKLGKSKPAPQPAGRGGI
jgi:hypothetical protein